jgi:hypothetical protein
VVLLTDLRTFCVAKRRGVGQGRQFLIPNSVSVENCFSKPQIVFKPSRSYLLTDLRIFCVAEKRADPTGRVYFVNHKNRTTQWEDPRTQGYGGFFFFFLKM